MKALRLIKPKELRLEDIPIPETDGTLVEIKAAGVCGTDVHLYEGHLPANYPVVLGHEIAGIANGQRVVVLPHIPCGLCDICISGRDYLCQKTKIFGLHIDGGFAEFINVSEKCLLPLPESITFEEGCIIPDAVSTAYHAVVCRGKVKPGDKVVIIGCGGLGIHAIKIASITGAFVTAIDLNKGSLENAKRAGAHKTINIQEADVKEIKRIAYQGADVAFEFVGNPNTTELAVKCLKVGGRAVIVGMSNERINLIPQRIFAGAEFELIGSMGSHRNDVKVAIELISSGKLDIKSSITHCFKLEEGEKAIQALRDKIGNPIRIVLSTDKPF